MSVEKLMLEAVGCRPRQGGCDRLFGISSSSGKGDASMNSAYPVLGILGGVLGERASGRESASRCFGQPCARMPQEPNPRLFTEISRGCALGNRPKRLVRSGLPTCDGWREGGPNLLAGVPQLLVHKCLMGLFSPFQNARSHQKHPCIPRVFPESFLPEHSPSVRSYYHYRHLDEGPSSFPPCGGKTVDINQQKKGTLWVTYAR
jgi:hypothetical protein